MSDGVVKFYDSLKGYGFITRAKGKDLFFHWTDIEGGYQGEAFYVGVAVQFVVDEKVKNRARAVTIVGAM